MGLADLIPAAQRALQGDEETLPFRLAALGEQVEAELAHPEQLSEAARYIIATAAERGCESVLGASPTGERLAAAAVALNGNGLRTFNEGTPARKVLIVDGALTSGSQLTRAARFARSAGVKDAFGVVVLALGPGKEALSEELTGLSIFLEG